MYPDWLNYIDHRRRLNMLRTLQELSVLQDKMNPNFIVIGALPLLINGYLKYKAFWDIDLLFRDDKHLKEFTKKQKSKILKIVNFDDELMVSKNISSLHTTWTFNHVWLNVDYILRKGFFEFYTHDINALNPYAATITIDNESFRINLYIARPWDIITEKIVSPRTTRDIDLKIDTSVDIRHIFAVYKKEKNNALFWNYILEKAKLLRDEREFKKKFLNILFSAEELGFKDLEISPDTITILKES